MTEGTGTLLISAHPDDVALSIGGSILAGYFPRPLFLVTVFSHGGYAPFYYGNKDPRIIDELRTSEDASFAAAIGARHLQLGLTDAATSMFAKPPNRVRRASSVIRGQTSRINSTRTEAPAVGVEATFEVLVKRVPRSLRWSLAKRVAVLDGAYRDVRRRLALLFSEHPTATVASPLALGLHPDHVLVTCACSELAKKSQLCYYEDLPYSRAYRLKGIRRHVTLLDGDLRPLKLDIEDVMGAKIDNLMLYRSQLDSDDIRKVLLVARGVSSNGRAYERIWRYRDARPTAAPERDDLPKIAGKRE